MSFREDLERQPIGALPLRDPVIAHPHTLLRAAVAVMRAKSRGCVVIVDHGDRPKGIFTEKSILNVLLENASLDERLVWEFADSRFFCFNSNEPMIRVWETIQFSDARYVCVTDDEGRLIGLTGQRGLAEYIAECFAKQTTVQRLGSKPWMRQREGA